ncbi:MAG TPA: STAS/SEC14 domain-containing protein [Polyangiaceae bacterium]
MSFGAPRVHRVFAESEYWLWLPQDTVVVSRITGRGTDEVADAMIEAFDKNVGAEPKVSIFTDLSEMTDYSSRARTVLTAWMKRNMPRSRTVHVAVKSKLVAMGVSVANLALRSGMKIHSDTAEFEEAIREEMVRLRKGG